MMRRYIHGVFTMKRILICGLFLILVAPVTEARRQQKKAGEIVGDIFKDHAYGFEVKVNENWKPKVGKEGEKVRIVLEQKNFSIPSDYINAKQYTKIPIVYMYVDTSSLGPHAFIDSLISPNYKSGQKNAILKEFEILNEPEQIPMQRSRLEIAGQSGLLWKVQAKYKKEVASSSSSMSGSMLNRSYGGAIAAVKIDDKIVMFYVITEWEFFEPVMQEVLPMIQSLKVLQEDEG
jgi:hypothetical protein